MVYPVQPEESEVYYGTTVFLVAAAISMICIAVATATLVIYDLINEIRRNKK